MWKNSVNLLGLACISFLLFTSCEKGSYQPAPASAEDQLRTQMRSAFEQTYPVTDLPVDWSEAIVYRRADSSRVAMVRLRGYLGEFGYNVRAKQYKGKLRAAYMACSPWLIVTVDRGATKAQAIVSSAIPQVEYLADTHYPLRYISVLNTQKFSGDIVVFDVRRKPLYRICYTDGCIDDQREPMTIGIVHKVLTKNTEEDPYMLDDVVVFGDGSYKPNPVDDFCLYNPQLCGIGEIGPITGTDEPEESDGPDQPPIPDGQDDNDQGQGSGGGNTGAETATDQANKEDAKNLFVFNPDIYKIMSDIIDKMRPDVVNALLQYKDINILFIPDNKAGNMKDMVVEIRSDVLLVQIRQSDYNNMSEARRAEHWMHELSHILYQEKYPNVPSGHADANDYQHYLMVNPPAGVTSLEQMFRDYFGDQISDPNFYIYAPYLGTEGSPVYNNFVNGHQERQDAIDRAKKTLENMKK